MQPAGAPDVSQLAEFERRYSRRRLLARYARGRVKHFASRQIMTFSGGALLAVTEGWATGVLAVAVALSGEALDCIYLHRIPEKIAAGEPTTQLRFVSTLTAFIQALTIAFCVCLAWFGDVSGLSTLFTTAFLAGAALNAGLVMPFHREAAIARLVVYGGVTVVLYALELLRPEPIGAELLLNASGSVMLAFMVALFLNFVHWGHRQQRKTTLELIRQGRALARHQKEAQQLSLVARNANDSVILSDHAGRIVWVNDAFSRITGYAPEEACGKTPAELLNGPETDPLAIKCIADAVRRGEPFRGEIQNVTKDGRQIWMETNLVPILDEQGHVEMSVAVERDITDAKTHAQEMAKARAAAEEGARAKSDFLATMSHEIRTPMHGVIGMADLLMGTDLTSDQNHYAKTIKSSATALLTIINDILELSRLDAGKMELNPDNFSLQACFDQTIQLLSPQAEAKGLKLRCVQLTELPEVVLGDEGRLRQILINLIGNAIKFTETGHVELRVSVEQEDSGFRLLIEVEDTGIGIPADKIDRVFERFSQAEASITRSFGGTGLGLAISHELASLMNGTITVDSTEGAGSCFAVRIRLAQAKEPDPQFRCEQECENNNWVKGRKILFAEDNKVNRVLIRKFLGQLPVQIEFAHDGREAVDKAVSLTPDLIFMDMSMPVMNGLDAAREIRDQLGDRPPIIALTANAFDSDRDACMKAGMDDFLSKPVGREDLVACMARHMRAPDKVWRDQ